MKVSKKQIQKWQQKELRQRDGHYANNLETEAERLLWVKQEAAMERIKNNPDLIKVIKRMKDR
jgi:hypothetical protein